MFSAIDHLVIVTSELEAAIEDYTAAGFTVIRGGRHDVGTHNALVALADGSYLELIAFLQPVAGSFSRSADAALACWYGALRTGGGIVDFCMRTDDLAADAAGMGDASIAMCPPFRMTRDRPDGYQLKWKLSIPSPPFNGRVPFLIEDETPRNERVPCERSHRNGVTGLGTLSVAVKDSVATAALYTRVLGRPGTPVRRPDFGGAGLSFSIGSHTVELIAPKNDDGPLADWITLRGESPYAATLTGRSCIHLETDLLCGARLSIS
jgi:hypothetical protein